jgi:hypothetical protein
MHLDSEIILIGTGIAPLAAASHLLSQGKSPLLINPDLDFFLENSELPFDPLLSQSLSKRKLLSNSPQHALQEIQPIFPGAIELWPHPSKDRKGYYDPTAPHFRQRGRLWIADSTDEGREEWEKLESLYLETSDSGLSPQILDGLPAIRRFPGASSYTDLYRGLYLPKLWDVDLNRFRLGLLDYLREKIPAHRVIPSASQLEITPEGLRFYSQGAQITAKASQGLLIFWTPRLTTWLIHQAKQHDFKLNSPLGVKLWEQWFLNLTEAPSPNTIGIYKDMAVWAHFEGSPSQNEPERFGSSLFPHTTQAELTVLAANQFIPFRNLDSALSNIQWASTDSFSDLSHLCLDFLKWDLFTIRSFHARALFEWKESQALAQSLSPVFPRVQIISRCDGPLVDVLQTVRQVCEALQE